MYGGHHQHLWEARIRRRSSCIICPSCVQNKLLYYYDIKYLIGGKRARDDHAHDPLFDHRGFFLNIYI